MCIRDSTYTISELNTGADGWEYDNTMYTLTFTVTLEDGELHASYTLTRDGDCLLYTSTSDARDYTYGTSQLSTSVNMRKCSKAISTSYWLRSPRNSTTNVAYCSASSGRVISGYYWYNLGVRPAMWVNLAG